MVDGRLAAYIQQQMKNGYSIAAIRDYLIRYGYQPQQLDEAIQSLYSTQVNHIIHFSPATLIGIAVIFIAIIGSSAFFFSFSDEKTQLLDINLEPVTTSVSPGQDLIFLTELANMGSSKRYDIMLRYELISTETKNIVTFKEETRGIETLGAKQTKLLVPDETEPGNYLLRALAEYNGQHATASMQVSINRDGSGVITVPIEAEKEPYPEALEEMPEQAIEEPQAQQPAQTAFDTLDGIEALAKSDRRKAEEQCASLQLQTNKDLCFDQIAESLNDKSYCYRIIDERTKDVCLSNVAKFIGQSTICAEIQKDTRRDNCYMNFVLDKKDYTICPDIKEPYLRQSCDSLRQLSELNITDISFYDAFLNQTSFELV